MNMKSNKIVVFGRTPRGVRELKYQWVAGEQSVRGSHSAWGA